MRSSRASGTSYRAGHTAADGGGLLNDIDFISCVCNVERSLNACNTAADNERALC